MPTSTSRPSSPPAAPRLSTRLDRQWWNAAQSCGNGALAAERVGDSATAVELRSLAADHWERSGNLPHLLAALIDLSATFVQAGSYAPPTMF